MFFIGSEWASFVTCFSSGVKTKNFSSLGVDNFFDLADFLGGPIQYKNHPMEKDKTATGRTKNKKTLFLLDMKCY